MSYARIAGVLALALAGCAHGPQVEKKQVKAQGDITVKPGLKLADLAPVAVANFTIVGLVKHQTADGQSEVLRQEHSDTMGVTISIEKMLLKAGVTMVDRQQTEQRMKELKHSTSELINNETARTFGEQIGAKTLITGVYKFHCEGTVNRTTKVNRDPEVKDDLFVKPTRVFSQSIAIKAFDVETGEVVFMVEQQLSENSGVSSLYPRPLSELAAKKLVKNINSPQLERAP